jgi:hypothetical protein
MAGKKEGHPKRVDIAKFLWPLFVELWIFVAIAIFFIIRIVGSHTAQRFLGLLKSSRPL